MNPLANWDKEFRLILKHTVKIGRRLGYTTTSMGDRRSTGETIITSAASVYFDYFADSNRYGGSQKRQEPGDYRTLDAHMFVAFDQDIQDGDMIYPVVGPVGMTIMRVVFTRPVTDFDGHTHHLECGLEKIG
jgi:hypothetical protein